MQALAVGVIERVSVIHGDELYQSAIRKIDLLIQQQAAIAHPGLQ